MNQLYGYAKDDLTLSDALEAGLPALSAKQAVALIYTPQRCLLAALENKELRLSNGKAVALAEVFEARIFNEDAELRWWHQQDGQGRVVLLSAKAQSECQKTLTEDVSLKPLHVLEQTYLLWGEGINQNKYESATGWSRLTAARIGRLDVPLPGASDQQRVQLKTLEYLVEYDADGKIVQEDNAVNESKRHGNVAVGEERLLKFEVVQ